MGKVIYENDFFGQCECKVFLKLNGQKTSEYFIFFMNIYVPILRGGNPTGLCLLGYFIGPMRRNELTNKKKLSMSNPR